MIRKFYMADVTVGARLELDAADGINSLKQLKGQIKEAQSELLGMQQKFGATSKEAIAAAKKVADLRDRMKEANEVADLFDPGNKFKAIGNAVNALTGGFTALTGAMSLLGVESEDVQKQLLKVQSALALSQGLSQISDSAKDFARLKDIIVNTFGKGGAIGIAIAGVTALGAALLGMFNRNKEAAEAQRLFGKAVSDTSTEVKRQEILIDQAKKGFTSKSAALKQYNETIGKTIGYARDLNEAEKLLADNADKYIRIQGLKAKATYLTAQAAEYAGKAELARLEIEAGGPGIAGANSILRRSIEDAERKADQLNDKVNSINKEIKDLSSGFSKTSNAGASVGGSSGAPAVKTAAGKQKLEEVEEANALSKWLEAENLKRFLKENELRELDAEAVAGFNDERFANIQSFENLRNQLELAKSEERIKIANAERDAKILAAQQIGNALGALADLVGRQTAAGKVLALAQIGIDTAVAISGAVRQASKNPLNLTGFAFVADMAARIGAIIANIAKAKQILSSANTKVAPVTQVTASQQAPLQATLPQSQRTLLDQQQLNQIGNAATRAFVVESDVTNNQERIRRLNRAARL